MDLEQHGFKAFGIDKPAELTSAAKYAAHIKARKPDAVVVALTHDHGDHMGDYFELLPALLAAGVNVKTVGQSDMMRVGLVPKFKAANLDPAQVVLNNGAGINMGGTATHGAMRLELVPAVHSTALGFPAAGFIIDIAGTRVYASGDTDLYGDMALIGRATSPTSPSLCTGNGAFTMGPDDAAYAVKAAGRARTRSPCTTRTTRSSSARSAAICSAPRLRARHRERPSRSCGPGQATTLQVAVNARPA